MSDTQKPNGAPGDVPAWADAAPPVGRLDRFQTVIQPQRGRVVLRYARGGGPIAQVIPIPLSLLGQMTAAVLAAAEVPDGSGIVASPPLSLHPGGPQ